MTKLNHIGIYVSDLANSISFYQEIFHFSVEKQFKSGSTDIALLDIGGGVLELIQKPEDPGVPPVGNWSHLALLEPMFDSAVKKLEEMSIETRKVTMENGNRLCFFKDPDGHMIEIMEKGL